MTTIHIEILVDVPIEKTWETWTQAEHIVHWHTASEDWHTPRAENELKAGGKFNFRMEAKDGSFGFDFTGSYDEVKPLQHIAITLDDDRKVNVRFTRHGDGTLVQEDFEAESMNSVELQQTGWQAILNNFKRYAESL